MEKSAIFKLYCTTLPTVRSVVVLQVFENPDNFVIGRIADAGYLLYLITLMVDPHKDSCASYSRTHRSYSAMRWCLKEVSDAEFDDRTRT